MSPRPLVDQLASEVQFMGGGIDGGGKAGEGGGAEVPGVCVLKDAEGVLKGQRSGAGLGNLMRSVANG